VAGWPAGGRPSSQPASELALVGLPASGRLAVGNGNLNYFPTAGPLATTTIK